jgi:hypothetical protein
MEDLSVQLRDVLAANDAPALIDPRTVPARFSTLKMFATSPLHYLHAVQRGYDETLSMRIGSGSHAVLFDQPYTVWTGKVRNGKAWDAFEAEHEGELILNARELGEALAIASAIRANPLASELLFAAGAVVEQRIDWEWNGREFRSTPDVVAGTACIDLKCLRSSEPSRVMWQSLKMFYHAQAALYRRALLATGRRIKDSYLVVVENKAPYPVTVLRFTDAAIDIGDRSCAIWLEQLRGCEAANHYPGYVQSIVDLDLPGSDLDAFTFEEDEEDGH